MANTLKIATEPRCAECGEPIEFARIGRTGYMQQWLHEGEDREPVIGPRDGYRGHMAAPVAKCADCGGPITHRQDAWADYSECKHCGTENRYGIGD
ncbi:hypothetical protein ACGF8D_10515 [Streptomyces massasporeus]|uniref:hypothetical protein n=1 Tax=Streptomyces massasporeus TaxID=67324 RepID=UPI0037223631